MKFSLTPSSHGAWKRQEAIVYEVIVWHQACSSLTRWIDNNTPTPGKMNYRGEQAVLTLNQERHIQHLLAHGEVAARPAPRQSGW